MNRIIYIMVALTWVCAAQTKAGVAPPRQIDKAARTLEQSWNGWLNSRPEQHLLDQPTAKALAAIDRSAAQAARYVADKKAYYQLIAHAFQEQADQLANEADPGGETPEAQQRQLDRLLGQEEDIRGKLAAMENEHDPRAADIKQAYRGQLAALQSLTTEAHARIKVLTSAAQTSTDAAIERKDAALAFGRVAAALSGLVDVTDLEAEDWAAYHEHLRQLVRDLADRGGAVKQPSPLQEDLDAIAPAKPPAKKEN